MSIDPTGRIAKGIKYWTSELTQDFEREDLIKAKLGHLFCEALERDGQLVLFSAELAA